MLNPSPLAAAAMTGDVRKIYIKAVIDLADPDIIYEAPAASDSFRHSRLDQLYNKNMDAVKYVTLEPGRWALDGTWHIFPDNPAASGETGYISDKLSDEHGEFSAPYPWASLNISNVQILQAAAVIFTGIPEDGYAADFVFEVLSGSDIVYSETVTGNAEAARYFDGFTVHYPTAIRVTFTRWSLPYRRARCIEIVPGVYENWENSTVYSLDIMQETDFSCMTLPYDTATLEIRNDRRRFDPRNKSGLFLSIEERQGIPLYLGVRLPDMSAEYLPCSVFYQQNGGWKTNRDGLTMVFKLVSIVGLLSKRKYDPPETLPTTLEGWAASLVEQLGENFKDRYMVDAEIATSALTCTKENVAAITCGDLLRFICQATGAYPRADSETGYLRISLPPESGGTEITLHNMEAPPAASANKDIAAIAFQINDGNNTPYTVGGTSAASSETLSVGNFFIKTTAQADAVARNIIKFYGGQRYEARGRGDLRSELGDLDAMELGQGDATGGRRYRQQFKIAPGGIMRNVPSCILQATGESKYTDTVVLTQSGAWTAPPDVAELKITLVGGGSGGGDGSDGDFGGGIGGGSGNGESGKGGIGGRVYVETVPINPGQTFSAAIGAGGAPGQTGGDTTFGIFSSRSGVVYTSWVDLQTGGAYGRTGADAQYMPRPGTPGTGDGGEGGEGGQGGYWGEKGITAWPTSGKKGAPGGSGCVIISFNRVVTA